MTEMYFPYSYSPASNKKGLAALASLRLSAWFVIGHLPAVFSLSLLCLHTTCVSVCPQFLPLGGHESDWLRAQGPLCRSLLS